MKYKMAANQALKRFSRQIIKEDAFRGYTRRAAIRPFLFGLTTAFLFAMVQICGVGQRRWLFWPLKELW